MFKYLRDVLLEKQVCNDKHHLRQRSHFCK